MGQDVTGHYGTPSGNSSRLRVSVDEAARELGLSVDAVRKRVQRGTIEHERDSAGRVRIILDSPDNTSTLQDESPDTTEHADALIDAKNETISELRERIKRLEHELDIRTEEVRRRDHLLAAALERIPPQLEAPQEHQNQPESASEDRGEGDDCDDPEASAGAQEATERPWWRRIFG